MPIPVVLIHGLKGSSEDWDVVREVFEAHGHFVETPDLPGLGSRSSENFSLVESVATIADAVRSRNEPPLLIGLGVGAHLAIDCAALIGGVAGVVAIGAGIRPLGWLLDSYRIASAANQLLPDSGAAVSESMADAFLRERSGGGRTVAGVGVFDDAVRQLHVLDTPAALARIDAPIWLVNGQFDRFRLQERQFLKACADGTLIRVRGTRFAGGMHSPAALTEGLLQIAAGF